MYEVVVVGAGPAGSSLASQLSRQGFRCLVCDHRSPNRATIGHSLPPAALPLLRDLGMATQRFANEHIQSYGNCSIWGSDAPVNTDFILDRNGGGWHLDRARFDSQLLQLAANHGAEVLPEARCVEFRACEHWHVVLSNGRTVRTRWLVDATGRKSFVARRLGRRRRTFDSLVCAHAVMESPLRAVADSRTWVQATRTGWWYTAPLPQGRRLVAWFQDADLLPRLWQEPECFLGHLKEADQIWELVRCAGYTLDARPSCVSAATSRLDSFCGPGWLAIGDSGMAFDPLSSQGLFHALFTGLLGARRVAGQMGADEFGVTLERIWDDYRAGHQEYYALEGRWRQLPFWARRQRTSGLPS